MKIIAVCGSPRRGNTEWMLDKLCQALEKRGAEVEKLLLRRLDIQMCRGCLSCEKGGKYRKGVCVIKDDMNALYPGLLAADAIVLATPGYMGMLSGRLKNFLDRTCAIWPHFEGKKLAGIAVAEETTGQVLQNLRYYGKLLKMQWVGGVFTFAKLPGDAAGIPGLEKRLERLAKRILSG